MKRNGGQRAGLSAASVLAAAFLMLGFDAAAQDAKKTPPPKAPSPCKGLDEKACKGKAAECSWIVPKKGKQRPYCRLKPASRTK
ncbi:MAG TPA: hypothetical protein VH913_15630 [Hyphomicrobiaceae bacterium]|jgi:hypothetical protein